MMDFSKTSAGQAGEPSLMDTIQHYYAGMADFDAQIYGHDNEKADAYAAKSWMPPFRKLEAWDAPAKSHTEALEALRLARKEAEVFACSELTVPLLGAVISFLEGKGGAA